MASLLRFTYLGHEKVALTIQSEIQGTKLPPYHYSVILTSVALIPRL